MNTEQRLTNAGERIINFVPVYKKLTPYTKNVLR